MRVETGDGEWIGIEPTASGGYYEITFGYNDNDVDAVTVTDINELRQIVAAIEKMEASDE